MTNIFRTKRKFRKRLDGGKSIGISHQPVPQFSLSYCPSKLCVGVLAILLLLSLYYHWDCRGLRNRVNYTKCFREMQWIKCTIERLEQCVCHFRYKPVCVQLNKGGNSLPFGRRVLGSRNSSKKPWAHASRGVTRAPGVYSRRRETSVMASTGVRGRKTYRQSECSNDCRSRQTIKFLIQPWRQNIFMTWKFIHYYFLGALHSNQ